MKKTFCLLISLFFLNNLIAQPIFLQKFNRLPISSPRQMTANKEDWLLKNNQDTSGVFKSKNGKDLLITNGLITRQFRVQPYFACFSFGNLVTPKEMIRAIQPEAAIEIDGNKYNIG